MTASLMLNAPAERSRFFGRTEDRKIISDRLSRTDCRLLTLVGTGGIGKTRLALSAAQDIAARGEVEVVFVPLQPLSAAQFIPDAIAAALGRKLSGTETHDVQLIRLLADKPCLLILDNFEHVSDGSRFLSTLLTERAQVQLLVTSREPLHLQEEWLYPVHGLTQSAADLFMHCARRIAPGFDPEAQGDSIRALCSVVGGSPLALELAAAWTNTLTCAEILDELRGSLELLATRLHNVPARHRSMTAVFDQSWGRLTRAEQVTCSRLSVFRGSFDLKAAREVAGASPAQLSRLIELSLVGRSAENRYQIHELTRQYAARHLSPTDTVAIHNAHADYYLALVQNAWNETRSGGQIKALKTVMAALDNIRVAWSEAWRQQHFDLLSQVVRPLTSFLEWAGYVQEAVQMLDGMLSKIGALPQDDAARCEIDCLVQKAWLMVRFARMDEAEQLTQQAIARQRQAKLKQLPGFATDPTTILALIATIRGQNAEALQLADDALHESEQANHTSNIALAQRVRCYALARQGRMDAALVAGEAARIHAQQAGDFWFMTYVLTDFGELALHTGQYAVARKHAEAAYNLQEQLGSDDGLAITQALLGEIYLAENDLDNARAQFEQAKQHWQLQQNRGGLGRVHYRLAQIALRSKALAEAREQLLAAFEHAIALSFVGILRDLVRRSAELLTFTDQSAVGDDWLAQLPVASESAETLLTFAQTVRSTIETVDLTAAPTPQLTGNDALIEPLTARELEVLALMAQGHSNPAIAEKLIIAVGTVKHYTARIYGKLGVKGRTAAVLAAQQRNLLA